MGRSLDTDVISDVQEIVTCADDTNMSMFQWEGHV